MAYFSDESGEVALHIKNQNGQGEAQKIDLGTPGSFFFFRRGRRTARRLLTQTSD